jgi:hypothetical protein
MAEHVYKMGSSFCAYIPSQTIDAFWSALTDVVYWSMDQVSIFDINRVACNYNSYRPNQPSPW